MVPEGGHDPLPGSGERDRDGQELCEDDIDLSALHPRLRARLERQAEEEDRLSREKREELQKLLPNEQIQFDAAIAEFSSTGLGGMVEALVTVKDVEQLKRIVVWAEERSVPYRAFGTGSSLIVHDGGMYGMLLRLGSAFEGISLDREVEGSFVLSVGAATSVQELCAWCTEKGAQILPAFQGCAGRIGGLLLAAPAEESLSIAPALTELTLVNKDGKELTITRTGLRFEEGRLKIPRTATIVRAVLTFTTSEAGNATLERETCPNDVEDGEKRVVTQIFRSPSKTPAAVLIEEAGLKNVRIGGARVSQDDACKVINEGHATARDLWVLMNLIRDRVRQETGVVLLPSVEFVGRRVG